VPTEDIVRILDQRATDLCVDRDGAQVPIATLIGTSATCDGKSAVFTDYGWGRTDGDWEPYVDGEPNVISFCLPDD